MRLIVKGGEGSAFLKIFYEEIRNAGPFSVVELILCDEDRIDVTDAHARISVDMRNDFIQEGDEKAMRFMAAQKIFLANVKRLDIGEPFIEEVMANRALAKAGYGDFLVYYYYILVSKMKKSLGFEEFIFASIPWLSLHGIDDYDTNTFQKMLSRFSYKKNFERDTKELFDVLKADIKPADVLKAVRLYRGLYAGYQV